MPVSALWQLVRQCAEIAAAAEAEEKAILDIVESKI